MKAFDSIIKKLMMFFSAIKHLTFGIKTYLFGSKHFIFLITNLGLGMYSNTVDLKIFFKDVQNMINTG